MRLYKVLDQYSDWCLYADTDSVIALIPPSVNLPRASGSFGELKDEIMEKYGRGAEIRSYSSISPKSYHLTLVFPCQSSSSRMLAEYGKMER